MSHIRGPLVPKTADGNYRLWVTEVELAPLGVRPKPSRRNTCACGCEHCALEYGYALTCGRLPVCEREAEQRRAR